MLSIGEPLDVEGSGVYANDLPWIGNPFSPDDDNNPAGMDDMEQARLVRWALAMAVDRESVNDQLLNGLGGPVYVEFIDPKSEHWQDKWHVPYDPAKAEEPSKQKRIDLMDQFFDFVHHWALQPGVVSVPELVIYNPNSIAEWQMEPTIFGESAFGNIVPNR